MKKVIRDPMLGVRDQKTDKVVSGVNIPKILCIIKAFSKKSAPVTAMFSHQYAQQLKTCKNKQGSFCF